MNVLSNPFSLESSPEHRRNYAIEGVRGVAILLVFLCHYADVVLPQFHLSPAWQGAAQTLSALGRTGVALFFVLSGYLIYRTVVRRNFRLLQFWGRRIQRIYPAFLVVFSIYLAMWLLHTGSDKTGEQLGARIPHDSAAASTYLVANLFFLPGIFPIKPLMNVAWSLSYEWFFYLLIPLGAVALVRLSKPYRLAFLGTTSALYLLVGYYQPSLPWAPALAAVHFIAAHNGLVMFLAGILIFETTQQTTRSGKPERRPDKLEWAALVTILLVLTHPGIEACLFVAYGLLLYFSVGGDGCIARLMSFKPLRAAGNISYSFYLIHGVPIHISASLASRIGYFLPGVLPALLFLPICLVFTTAVSLALFVFVERPLSLRPGHEASGQSSPSQKKSPLNTPIVPSYVE